jgi:hypothetical protein
MTTPFPFVASAVLTAAQLNAITELPVSAKTTSYVLTAADAGTRVQMTSASATTITINTGLFTAGQSVSIYNNGTGACTVTGGTATVTSTGALTLPQYGGGTLYFTSSSTSIWFSNVFTTAGLVPLISETSVSAVSAITVDNIFTSAYTNYLMIANLTSSAGDNLFYKLRAGGVSTSTNYGNSSINQDGATIAGARTTAQTAGSLGALRSASQNAVPLNIYSPQTAQWTKVFTNYLDTVTSTTFYDYQNASVQTTTTQFDGITLFCSTATITGTYSIYGYSK